MATATWSELVRELVRGIPSARPEEGTAYDCLLDLCEAGCKLSAEGDRLMVTPPPGWSMPQDMRQQVTRHKALILALLKPPPTPVFPIDWEQEWRLEADSMLRKAAEMVPGCFRDELLSLARQQCSGEKDWMGLAFNLVDLEFRIASETGSVANYKKLTPWQGWVRGGAGLQWAPVDDARHEDFDVCWAALVRHTYDGEHCEKMVLPAGRHPDGRRKGVI